MARRSRVVGDKELIENMRRIARSVSGAALDHVMRESLEPLRLKTQENAFARRQPGARPKGGHLDEGVVTAPMEKHNPYRKRYWVTFRNRARKIAHLVELGTAPHWQPRRFGGIMHPGARPYPFMRPAYFTEKSRVVDEFGRRTWGLMKGYTLQATKTRRAR